MKNRLSKNQRLKALAVIAVIAAVAIIALLIANGRINSSSLFGYCSFEQSHNMPCPFCGMTQSVCMFVKGDIIGSFKTQPAGTLLAILTLFAFVYFALRAAGFELQRMSRRIEKVRIWKAVIFIIIAILIGWAVSIYNYNRL